MRLNFFEPFSAGDLDVFEVIYLTSLCLFFSLRTGGDASLTLNRVCADQSVKRLVDPRLLL